MSPNANYPTVKPRNGEKQDYDLNYFEFPHPMKQKYFDNQLFLIQEINATGNELPDWNLVIVDQNGVVNNKTIVIDQYQFPYIGAINNRGLFVINQPSINITSQINITISHFNLQGEELIPIQVNYIVQQYTNDNGSIFVNIRVISNIVLIWTINNGNYNIFEYNLENNSLIRSDVLNTLGFEAGLFNRIEFSLINEKLYLTVLQNLGDVYNITILLLCFKILVMYIT